MFQPEFISSLYKSGFSVRQVGAHLKEEGVKVSPSTVTISLEAAGFEGFRTSSGPGASKAKEGGQHTVGLFQAVDSLQQYPNNAADLKQLE